MPKGIYVIFDGSERSPEGERPHTLRFVEVEDADGKSLTIAWEPYKDVFWRLGPFFIGAPEDGTDLKIAEAKIERLTTAGEELCDANPGKPHNEAVYAWQRAKHG